MCKSFYSGTSTGEPFLRVKNCFWWGIASHVQQFLQRHLHGRGIFVGSNLFLVGDCNPCATVFTAAPPRESCFCGFKPVSGGGLQPMCNSFYSGTSTGERFKPVSVWGVQPTCNGFYSGTSRGELSLWVQTCFWWGMATHVQELLQRHLHGRAVFVCSSLLQRICNSFRGSTCMAGPLLGFKLVSGWDSNTPATVFVAAPAADNLFEVQTW